MLLGAGLPALVAVGIRALAGGQGVRTGGTAAPVGRVVAGVCFLVVLLAVALGLTYIVASGFGKVLDFGSGYPTIVDKT